eukprot:1025612-Rhodomonas_salina.1
MAVAYPASNAAFHCLFSAKARVNPVDLYQARAEIKQIPGELEAETVMCGTKFRRIGSEGPPPLDYRELRVTCTCRQSGRRRCQPPRGGSLCAANSCARPVRRRRRRGRGRMKRKKRRRGRSGER